MEQANHFNYLGNNEGFDRGRNIDSKVHKNLNVYGTINSKILKNKV